MQLQNITVFYLKILYWISQVKIVLNSHMNKFGLQSPIGMWEGKLLFSDRIGFKIGLSRINRS